MTTQHEPVGIHFFAGPYRTCPHSGDADRWHQFRSLGGHGLDALGQVLDLHRPAVRLRRRSTARFVWHSAAEVFAVLRVQFRTYLEAAPACVERALEIGPTARHVELRISPLAKHAGYLPVRPVELTDVIERKQAELALRESEARLCAVLDHAPIVLFATDRDGRIIAGRGAGLEAQCFQRKGQLSGQSVFAVFGDVAEIGANVRRALAGEAFTARLGVAGRIFECAYTPARNVDGNVTGVTGVAIDVTQRIQAEELLEHRARHDMLTELPNRSHLQERLEHALGEACAHGLPVAVLLLDLDHFKEINEILGHGVGDDVLRQVARRFQRVMRPGDTIARMGGDEFAVVLPTSGYDHGMEVACALRQALAESIDVDGLRLDVGVSVGLAFRPDHGQDTSTLLRRAEIAMYAAKRAGQGVAAFDPEQDRQHATCQALASELRAAIDHDQLILHYQPKVELATRRLARVEALVRWQHPIRGMLAPAEFIPLAEKTGLIDPLTRWVLRRALEQARIWRGQGLDLIVAANIAARNLFDANFPDTVRALLAEAGLPPNRLELELTESTLMADAQRGRRILEELRGLGVSIAIDDFGTGYSSLSYLKDLPVDTLKIDRSFIADLASDLQSRAIVRSMIDLARALGLRVVGEGVEDEATLRQLALLGCDLAQGYYVCRPVPAAKLEQWARRRHQTSLRAA